ncbi:MAG: hypothetical protein J6O13_01040 [Selenomonas sp.]|nr:hypothetical protein [Selenomonas sp.]
MTTNNLSIALSIAYEVELCNNIISLANMFGGAQGRFFHGFALSTHFRFEDGVNDGFVAAFGVEVGLDEGYFFRGEEIGELAECWRFSLV